MAEYILCTVVGIELRCQYGFVFVFVALPSVPTNYVVKRMGRSSKMPSFIYGYMSSIKISRSRHMNRLHFV